MAVFNSASKNNVPTEAEASAGRYVKSAYQRSIVLAVNFKICLGMRAYRADFKSLGCHYDMTTVAAFPYLDFALCKNFLSLYIAKQCAVSFLVVLFNGGNSTKLRCEFNEAFVHISPLVVFTVCGNEFIKLLSLNLL